MPLENLDDLNAAWAVFLEDRNVGGKITQAGKWRLDNPVEWEALKAYHAGSGPRPTLKTQMGRQMVEVVDALIEARATTPDPDPDPGPDPGPTPSVFGGDLPARNAPSKGSVVTVSSESQLAAVTRPAPGTIVRLAQGFAIGRPVLSWQGTQAAPITLDLAGKTVTGGQLVVSDGAYMTIANGKRAACADGLKIDGSSHHVETDLVNVDGATNMAFNVQGPSCHHLQFWCFKVTNGGDGSPSLNQDHAFYFNGITDSVIAAGLIENQMAFAGQAYPNAKRCIITGVTSRGRKPQSVAGGWYLGDGAGSSDHTLVGLLVEDSSEIGIWNNGANNRIFDSIVRRSASSPFLGSGFTHCVDSDTQPVTDFVQAARYGLLPPVMHDGSPRRTADAGG